MGVCRILRERRKVMLVKLALMITTIIYIYIIIDRYMFFQTFPSSIFMDERADAFQPPFRWQKQRIILVEARVLFTIYWK